MTSPLRSSTSHARAARATMMILALLALPLHSARAQTPALDAERESRAADALSNDALRGLAGLYRGARLLDLHAERAGARTSFLADVAKRGASPIVRDHARYQLAVEDARTGALDAAAKGHRAIGIVPSALMIGPFGNTGGASFGAAAGVEPIAESLDAAVMGLERAVRWHPIALEPRGAWDLASQMTAAKETRAFVAFVAEARTATPIALRIGSSGQVRALVNGAEVGRDDAQRDHALDQSVFAAQLVAGANLVVVELGILESAGLLTVRLTRPDGTSLTGVTTRATADDVRRALKTAPSQRPPPVVAHPTAGSAEGERLRMRVDVEVYVGAQDERRKPAALRTWLEALLAEPTRPALERASLLARLGVVRRSDDLTRARELYEEALALDPRNVVAWYELADVREDQGRIHEARALWRRAAEAAPHSDLAQQRALEFLRRHGETGVYAEERILARAQAAPTHRNLMAAADILDERGDMRGALSLARRAGDAAWVARLETEIARARLVDDPAALAAFITGMQTQLALRPAQHDLAERIALTLESAGRAAEADALVAARRALYPERAEPDAVRAKLALARADRGTARDALRAAIEKNPQDAELARLRRALETEDELVARYGVTLEPLRALPVSPDAARPGAELLAHTTAIRLFDNGLARTVTDRVLRVVDAKKARGLQRQSYDFTEGRETLEVLVAEKWSAAGRKEAARRISDQHSAGKVGGVYTDAAAKIVEFGPLEDGDVLFVRLRKELGGRQNLFGDFFGVIEPLQGLLPQRNWRLVIEAPVGQTLYWGGRNAPKPREQVRDGVRVYDFTRASSAAIVPEPQMPPFFELTDFVSVTTYASWEAMGTWYEALAAPSLALDDELRAIAKREKDAAQGEADLVRRLYEYVVTSTRYVGIELGIHGWKPYPVAEVHRRKYGDCKDKASLLVALLREAGVAANLALVRTANLGSLADAPPSMWSFNHAIAYVPSLDLFLDGTAEQSGWRELPTMDQGGQSLIVGAHGPHAASRLVTIPLAPGANNLNVSDYTLTLDESGTLQVRGKERFRGHANAEERRNFADAATQRDVLQRHLARIMPGTVVQSVTVTDLSLAQQDLGYDFSATLPARAVREANDTLSMPLSLYPHDLAGNYADRSTRKSDVYMDHPWRTQNVMRYVLPAGYEVPDLPRGGTVENAHMRFVQRVERTPDGFIVDEDASVLSRRIPLADYAAFREAALAADALMKRKIRIVKKGGAG